MLLYVQRFPGETAILPLQMRHLVAMNLHFYSDQRENRLMVKFSQVCAHKWASNMLIFHVDVNMKQLGIHFKTDSFQ